MNYRQMFLNGVVIADVETTSVDKKETEIIELGTAIYDGTNWVDNSKLFKPTLPIPPDASAVNHISNAMVADCPNFMEVDTSELCHLKDDYEVYVAHNAGFDRIVLESHNVKVGPWLCTYQLSKKLFTFIGDESITRMDLQYLRYALDFNITEDISAHRAGSDCVVTGYLLLTLLDILEQIGKIDVNLPYMEQIEDFMNTPVILSKVPFGKHKGQRFEDVPRDYWDWALRNMDSLNESHENYDDDLASSILRALE